MLRNRKPRLLAKILLTISLCFVLSIGVSAAENKITFSVEDIECTAGTTISVPVVVTNNTGLVSASLSIEFDSSILSLIDVFDAGLLGNAVHTPSYSSPYYLTWENDISISDYTANGTLATLVFKVTDTASEGEYSIGIHTFENDGILNSDGIPVDCTFVSGCVSVKPEVCMHKWADWKSLSSYKHKRACSICGEYEVAPHNWDDGKIALEPTSNENGVRTYTCKVCSAQKNEIIPALEVEKYTLSGTVTSYGDDETTVTTLHLYAGSGTEIDVAPSYTCTVSGNGEKPYSFNDISSGTYTLRVSKAGHITKDYVITIDDEDVELDVEITLKETANVTMAAEVTQFSSDSASVNIQATSSSDFFGQFFVASYDEDGKMLDVKVYPAAEEVLAQVDKVGSSVKVFWVDNQTSFTPVCPTVPLSTEVLPDNLYYDVHDAYVEITKYAGTDTDLTIPKTIEGIPVTKIGMYAFDGCSSLKTLTLQSGITEIDAFAFNDCTSLETIVLPDGLKTIGDLAFQSCRKLTAITIPDGVTALGWNIFNNCLALKETHIPTSVVTVDGKTIVWDQAGTGITVAGDISSYFFYLWTELENVVIEDGCTYIGESAFMDCTSLTSIVLPESITTMESRVFADCTNLLSVTVPSKVTELGDFTFSGCRSMTNIVLPASLKTIGSYVFQSCDSFVEVEIPTGVMTLGDGAFNVCRNLKKVIIPDSVTTISDTAFNHCTDLTIYCAKGSYADIYAQNKNFLIQYV